jgi:hypothetical protein
MKTKKEFYTYDPNKRVASDTVVQYDTSAVANNISGRTIYTYSYVKIKKKLAVPVISFTQNKAIAPIAITALKSGVSIRGPQNAAVNILALNGRIVGRYSLSASGKCFVNNARLGRGVYIILVKAGNNSITRQFVRN